MDKTMKEPNRITRRRFFCALAASAVAAGVPLPVGLKAQEIDDIEKNIVYEYFYREDSTWARGLLDKNRQLIGEMEKLPMCPFANIAPSARYVCIERWM